MVVSRTRQSSRADPSQRSVPSGSAVGSRSSSAGPLKKERRKLASTLPRVPIETPRSGPRRMRRVRDSVPSGRLQVASSAATARNRAPGVQIPDSWPPPSASVRRKVTPPASAWSADWRRALSSSSAPSAGAAWVRQRALALRSSRIWAKFTNVRSLWTRRSRRTNRALAVEPGARSALRRCTTLPRASEASPATTRGAITGSRQYSSPRRRTSVSKSKSIREPRQASERPNGTPKWVLVAACATRSKAWPIDTTRS